MEDDCFQRWKVKCPSSHQSSRLSASLQAPVPGLALIVLSLPRGERSRDNYASWDRFVLWPAAVPASSLIWSRGDANQKPGGRPGFGVIERPGLWLPAEKQIFDECGCAEHEHDD